MNGDILVMDDQIGIRTLIKEALELEGHRVDTVCSGQELIELIYCYNYDFIITDLMIPDFQGTELVSELIKYEKPEKIMVISGLSCSKTRQMVKQQGINIYLEKPFDLDRLKSQVNESLEQITA